MTSELRHPMWCLRATGLAALLLLAAALLPGAGCSEADSLGGEAPDEVVISGTPTWANGVGELMTLKCAVCHRHPAPDTAPDNTPAGMDLSRLEPATNVAGPRYATEWIDAGLLQGETDGVPQMPPEFATPLTSGEITALETWSAGILDGSSVDAE